MQMKWKVLMTSAALVMGATACTSAETKRELDQQVKAEPATTQGEVAKEAQDKLMSNPNLSDEQKQQLRILQERTRAELVQTRAEYAQTQSLLIQKLADPNAKLKEVDYLRQKMKKLGYKQTDLQLTAVNRASEIVGKKTPLDADFYQPFFEPDGAGAYRQVQ